MASNQCEEHKWALEETLLAVDDKLLGSVTPVKYILNKWLNLWTRCPNYPHN